MQIKMNKDIMEYKEEVYFGMTLRQLICSTLALIAAGVLYFALRHHLSTETRSWVCMLGAAPFAALGFFRYSGMSAEQFFTVWLRHMLMPRRLPFQTEIKLESPTNEEEHHVSTIQKSISALLPKR